MEGSLPPSFPAIIRVMLMLQTDVILPFGLAFKYQGIENVPTLLISTINWTSGMIT